MLLGNLLNFSIMTYTGDEGLHSAFKGRVNKNVKTGLWVVEENGISYSFGFSIFIGFKNYFAHPETIINEDSIERWYNQLIQTDRKYVKCKPN